MQEYQKEALKLAKNAILEEFWEANLQNYYPQNKELLEKKSCFVTLKTNKKILRWCIWNIFPIEELYLNIIRNAKNAAFRDPRFPPITKQELKNIFLEISILTIPEEKNFQNIEELLSFLEKNRPWLVIELFWKSATFLPSVWEEIKNPWDFLTHLILKAWIDIQFFIDNFSKVKIEIYESIEFWEFFEKI